MYLYEKLEELIGTEVELFENRNTGRLEIRPSEGEGKKSVSGRYISDVGEDYILVEVRGVGRPHFDAYPLAQIALRDWDDRFVGKGSRNRPAKEGPGRASSPNRPDNDEWL